MPDIDYGQILEALNDKVDLSGSWSAPTAQITSMTIGQPGDTYTAPADGYFRAYMIPTTTSNYWLYLENTSSAIATTAYMVNIGYATAVFVPVKKGQTVILNWRADGAYSSFGLQFIYAQKTN